MLIGDPVCYSISDKVYPLLFPEYSLVGEFSKRLIKSSDLEVFFQTTPPYDFITVTMPHKLSVVPFCHSLTKDALAIGCVNYISIQNNRLIGCNFDGIGALDVIEEKISVKGKVVVVVGAGGAARAAIYEAKKRGSHVICVNRTKSKGEELASIFEVVFEEKVPQDFDVLINATSIGMDKADSRQVVLQLPGGKVVLDMASRDGECLLKKKVLEQNGEYISGSKMFYALTRAGLSFISNSNALI